MATGGLDGEGEAELDGNSSLLTLIKTAGVSSSESFVVNLNENKLLCFAMLKFHIS